MVRIVFKDGVSSYLKIMEPNQELKDKVLKDMEWASPHLLEKVEKSLQALHPGSKGLYDDLVTICGLPLKIEWKNQIKVSRQDAMFLKIKYANLIDHISD